MLQCSLTRRNTRRPLPSVPRFSPSEPILTKTNVSTLPCRMTAFSLVGNKNPCGRERGDATGAPSFLRDALPYCLCLVVLGPTKLGSWLAAKLGLLTMQLFWLVCGPVDCRAKPYFVSSLPPGPVSKLQSEQRQMVGGACLSFRRWSRIPRGCSADCPSVLVLGLQSFAANRTTGCSSSRSDSAPVPISVLLEPTIPPALASEDMKMQYRQRREDLT